MIYPNKLTFDSNKQGKFRRVDLTVAAPGLESLTFRFPCTHLSHKATIKIVLTCYKKHTETNQFRLLLSSLQACSLEP